MGRMIHPALGEMLKALGRLQAPTSGRLQAYDGMRRSLGRQWEEDRQKDRRLGSLPLERHREAEKTFTL